MNTQCGSTAEIDKVCAEQKIGTEKGAEKENEKAAPAAVAHLIEILITAAPVNG